MTTNYKDVAKVFKSFCDENRLHILEILKSGEHCACELQEDLNISQSTLSHHMKILVDAQVVTARKEGKWMYYSLSAENISGAKEYLDEYLNAPGRNESRERCAKCLS